MHVLSPLAFLVLDNKQKLQTSPQGQVTSREEQVFELRGLGNRF